LSDDVACAVLGRRTRSADTTTMSRRDLGRRATAPRTRGDESPLRAVRRTVSRVAGVTTFMFVPVAFVEALLAAADGRSSRAVGFALLATMSLLVGATMVRVDWHAPRWGWLPLLNISSMLAMVALANGLRPQPYQAGLHLVTLSVWIGVILRPRHAVALAPLYAAAFWVPLHLAGASEGYSPALPSVVASALAASTVVAWLTEQLGREHGHVDAERRRYQALVAEASDVTVVVGTDGVVAYASPSSERVLGFARDHLAGQVLDEAIERWVHPDDGALALAELTALTAGPGSRRVFTVRVARPDGGWRDCEWAGRNLSDDPVVGGLLFGIRDVSEQKALERTLEHRAFHDELTGLPNRALLLDRLRQALSRTNDVALLFCDLDGFKAVNDAYGHEAGDLVLKAVAGRMAGIVRSVDTVARLAGDEFAVLLEGATRAEVIDVADRIVEAVADGVSIGEQDVSVGVSVGVAWPHPDDADGLADADLAMYAAKADGGSAVRVFEVGLRDEVAARLSVLRGLRRAIEQDELVLHYQPVVDTASGRLLGVEALLRWQHPEHGLLGPGAFLAVAEESRQIVPIGAWVLEEACRALVRWRERFGVPDLYVAVNVAVAQLEDDTFPALVATVLAETGLPPSALTLEITETALIAGGAAIDRLHELKRIGVRLAVDDFGTGYSSLRYLQDLPVDVVKVDKAFVDRLDTADTRSVVQAILELADRLGMTTVAEGVEAEDRRQTLEDLGSEAAQGFLFSPAVPECELAEMLRSRPAGRAAVRR
jgi:diguanylate cyclase (GGDEF)-like protein/PAS domain S-box-containing protein